jgi:hypothetical protein
MENFMNEIKVVEQIEGFREIIKKQYCQTLQVFLPYAKFPYTNIFVRIVFCYLNARFFVHVVVLESRSYKM